MEKGTVNIRKAAMGYFIEVKDKFSFNKLAVTEEELKEIVLYGQVILRDSLSKEVK